MLTHHETTARAAAAGPGQPVARPPAGPPPRTGDGAGPHDPGHGRPRRRPRIRRWLYGLVGLVVLGPLLAFVLGWFLFRVPSGDDIAVSQVATFTFADGSPLATVRPDNVNRVSVRLDEVPPHVRQAVLAAEDRSFFSNPGFDVTGIGRAVWSQLTGGSGGGSTITQQYVKVTTGQDQFSLWRKYKEVVLAVKISKEQTKEQILENYLNAIYLGRGAYGVQAASQAYFGKDVKDLSVSEGAMLAGIIQSPSRWDPAKNADKAGDRWNFVLDGMVAQGWLSPADRAVQRFPQWRQPTPTGGGIPGDSRGHIYNQVRAELEQHGITDQQVNTEGLTITTTIDPTAQRDAVDAAHKVLEGQPANLRSALVSVDPRTGAVLAYYGGDNGVGLDYAQVLKQPGSSFKPFVFAAALEAGRNIGLGTRYDGSSPQTFPGGVTVGNSEGVSCVSCSVQTAMTQSINTVFYRMALDVGPARVAEAAHRAGIPADLLPRATGGIALGDQEVHPVDMASAFATFAADGVRHEPYLVAKVVAADGRVIYDRGTPEAGQPAFPMQIARNVTASLTDVASSSRIPLSDGRPVAAKTGTVQSSVEGQNNDAWTVGYTPSVSTAVWVGTDDNSPIKNASGRPIYGRMLPGSIWQSYMGAALQGTPREQFPAFTPLGEPPVSDGLADSSDPSSPSSPPATSSPSSRTPFTVPNSGRGSAGSAGDESGQNSTPFDQNRVGNQDGQGQDGASDGSAGSGGPANSAPG